MSDETLAQATPGDGVIHVEPVPVRDTVDGGLARHLGSRPETDGLSAEDATREYHSLRADPDFVKALTDKTHPTHQAATERRRELLAKMYPADPTDGDANTASDDKRRANEDETADRTFRVPEDAAEYRLVAAEGGETDVELAGNVGGWMKDAGVPVAIGRNLHQCWEGWVAAGHESHEAIDAVESKTNENLARRFGDKYAEKLAMTHDWLKQQPRWPEMREFFQQSRVLADEGTVLNLIRAAEFDQRKNRSNP